MAVGYIKSLLFSFLFLYVATVEIRAQVIQSDYDALVAFYNSTNGASWTNKTGWLGPNDASISTWFGVSVVGNRVVQINLTSNSLSGSLPNEIGDLTGLTHLLLGPDQPPFITNNIGGSIPTSIGSLTNLIRLNLQFNAFSGAIPDEIGNLSSLVRLELSANQLSGSIPESITSLANLQHLALGVNSLTSSLPAQIGDLNNLRSLSVANNQLSGSLPASLFTLTQLTSLQLQINQFSGNISSAIGNLTALQTFIFLNNNFSGGLPDAIGGLASLRIIQGDINPNLGGAIPATIGNLSNLQTLTLFNTGLTGSIPDQIQNLTSLTNLQLYNNQLSGELPNGMGALTLLTTLRLENNQLTGDIPTSFSNLTALTNFRIQSNQFTAVPNISAANGLNGTTNFQIQNNRLTFESIEPNLVRNPNYAPQAQIPGIADFTVASGSPFDLSYTVGGSNNVYQWFKDASPIDGATNDTYVVLSANAADAGAYYLRITNTNATALTLTTEVTNLQVQPEGPSVSDVDICLGDDAQLTASDAPVGADYLWYENEADVTPVFTGNPFIVTAPPASVTYYVSFLDGAVESLKTPVSITVNVSPTISLDLLTDPSTCNGTDGSIQLTGLVADTEYSVNYELNASAVSTSIFSNASGELIITNLSAGTFTNISVTITGCTSNVLTGPFELVGPLTPTIALGTITNPATCGANGTIELIFTNVPDGIYDIDYDGGTFADVAITAGVASISAPAGTYNDLSITLGTCISAENPDVSLTDPSAPTIALGTVSNPSLCGVDDGSIQLTGLVANTEYTVNYELNASPVSASIFSNASGELLINNLGAGTYANITVTIVACTSNILTGPINLTEPPTPTLSVASLTAQTSCSIENGEIVLTFTDVPDGTFTINYDVGTFTEVEVLSNLATIITGPGTYNDLQITIAGCTSVLGVNAEVLANYDVIDVPVANDKSRCDAGVLILRASGATGAQTYRWYTEAVGGTPIPDENTETYTTPVLAVNTTYYVSIADGFCESNRVAIEVTILNDCDGIFIVNSTLDTPDENVGDGLCDDGLGNCTLRAAIMEANVTATLNDIHFVVPGVGPHRITLTSALPTITSLINIDARTQTDYVIFAPQVMVDGSAVAGISGLVLEAGSSQSEIRGLSIGGFVHGIIIRSDENIIQECFIGVEADGLSLLPNTESGIYLLSGNENIIGGDINTNRNIISGHTTLNAVGIRIENASDNIIQGNYLGTAEDGRTGLGNSYAIRIVGNSANNLIGESFGPLGNLISGNARGISVEGLAAGTVISGNIIGLNVDDEALSNTSYGIRLDANVTGTIVGGDSFDARNVVAGSSGGGSYGIGVSGTKSSVISYNYIGTNSTGDEARANFYGIYFTGEATGNIIDNNLISANTTNVYLLASAGNNIITANTIGTDITGSFSLRNGTTGIDIRSNGNIIGGGIGEGNLISGINPSAGIAIRGEENVIYGNWVGPNRAATEGLSSGHGISLFGASNNVIGSVNPDFRNVISGSTTGIYLESSSNNTIIGNYVGLAPDGLSTISNSIGISINGLSSNNQIGGPLGDSSNYISGNGRAIYVSGTGGGNAIQGNIIGLNTANEVRPNTSGWVIWYVNQSPNLIGGSSPIYRNVISGNGGDALFVSANNPQLTLTHNYFGTTPDGMSIRANTGPALSLQTSNGSQCIISNNIFSGSAEGIRLWNGTTNYRITGNKIGTNLTGDAAIPNGIGIRLNLSSTQNNIIGGYGADANIISGNTLDGIRFTDGANNNQVIGNYIGTAADGITPLPNEAYGIEFQFGTSDNTIGGDNPQDGNIIANNLLGGVRMTHTVFTAPARNRVTQNLIFDNGGLGIMLGATGPNLNDPVDADEGINRRQNYPIISETFNMDIANDLLELEYYVPSDPAFSTYPIRVEFFADDGNRQGRQIIYVDEFTEDDYLLLRPKQLSIDISGLGLVSTDIPVASATDAEGNTSEFGFIVPDPPSVDDEEACSGYTATFTASGASGTGVYRWYTTLASATPTFTGNPFTTPVLSATTTYYVAIFDNSHESVRVPVEVVVFDSPIITVASLTHQSSCVEPNGIIALEFQFVPDGIYTISYDGGTFTGVEVTAGEASIIADIGVYNDLQITVDACTSLLGVNAEILDEIIIPVITVTNINNQTSCLTVNSSIELLFTNVPDGLYTITYEGGNFIDVEILSNAAIIPATVGVYNDLQITVGVCNSVAGVNAEILDQILIPEITVVSVSAQTSCAVDNGEIRLSFVNVPDGAYTISFDGGTFDDVVVTSGEAIIMANIGEFNDLQITVGDCTSDLGIDAEVLNAIVIPEMELTSAVGQNSCLLDNGAINLSFNNVPDGLYDIVYDGGIFEDVAISSGTASIIAGPANYFNLFITLGDCQSVSAVSAVIDDLISTPTLTVSSTTPQTSCLSPDGSITLSFTNVPDGFYDISFDGGSFDNVEVISGTTTFIAIAAAYNNLQITAGDCASALGINAIVEDEVGIPVINVVEVMAQSSCSAVNGSILLSFTNVPDGSYTINYDGGSFTNVTVSGNEALLIADAGDYNNLSITVDDCTSVGVNVTVSDETVIPAITLIAVTDQTSCTTTNGSIELSFTNVTDGTYTITYDGGSFADVEVTAGEAIIITDAGVYNNLQIIVGDCASAAGVDAEVIVNYETIDMPEVTNVQRCGTGSLVLTASGASAGQSYRWYTQASGGTPISGETSSSYTTPSISNSTTYYVSIVEGICESDREAIEAIILVCDNIFIVNSTLDTSDSNIGDGICDDGNGNCTFRAALQEVNASPQPSSIHFNIPGTAPYTIQPSAAYPTINRQVNIDARTQPGYGFGSPLIVLNGVNAGNVNGLNFSVTATASEVRGFSIVRFALSGIRISANDGVIQENFIGVERDGLTAGANGQGVNIVNGNDVLIGGPILENRNVISGNNSGILISSGSRNIVAGNYIGLNASGIAAVPNRNGIVVQGTDNIIGGDAPEFTNVISGNGVADNIADAGLQISSTGNMVRGNIIGLDASGTFSIPNEDGIRVGGNNNTIGGANTTVRNIISGNSRIGISSGFPAPENLLIEGNFIGTNISGTAAVGNTNSGILMFNGSNSIIRNNVVSGNQAGIDLQQTTAISLLGNKVGTDHTGSSSIPNSVGIRLMTSTTVNNQVGGANAGDGNIVSGNTSLGILISGGASQNRILGNKVGINMNNAALPNATGIHIAHGFDNVVGGRQAGENNTIANNNGPGIRVNKILTSDPDPQRNRITGNSIFANSGLGIALGLLTVQVNDPGDADNGPNKLQNYPLIYTHTYDQGDNRITLTYDVNANPITGNSVYPIEVEFFIDDGNRQGRTYLHTDVYTAANFNNGRLKTISFIVPIGIDFTSSDKLVSTATDADGNTSEFGFNSPQSASASGVTICAPSSVTLNATGAPTNGSYRWYANQSNLTPLSTNQVFTTPLLNVTTTYYLAARDNFGHESLRIPVTVVVGTIPPAPEASYEVVCTISDVVIMASGANANQQYAWYNDLNAAPLQIDFSNVFVANIQSASSRFYVKIIDESGCESAPFTIDVIVNLIAAPVVTSPNNFTFCEGESIVLQGPAGFDVYLWSDGSNEQNLTVTEGGTYTLTVFDANGCSSATTTVSVVETQYPEAVINIVGDRLQTSQATSYQWYYFGQPIVGATNSFLSIDLLKYGIYQVAVTNTSGCTSLSLPFEYLITSLDIADDNLVRIYPNPARDKVSMHVNNNRQLKYWKIMDAFGKLIYSIEAESIEALDVSEWSAGMYIIYINTDNRIIRHKFIKL
jgi:CSLREA domain-containing protein